MTFVTYFTDETRHHRVKGVLRNLVKMQVEYEVDQIGQRYCQKQLYDTHIDKAEIKPKPVPDQVPELIHQRMYGVALQYPKTGSRFQRLAKDFKDCIKGNKSRFKH